MDKLDQISDIEEEIQSIIEAGEAQTGLSLIGKFGELEAICEGGQKRLVGAISGVLKTYSKQSIMPKEVRESKKVAREEAKKQEAIEAEKERLFAEAHPEGFDVPTAETE